MKPARSFLLLACLTAFTLSAGDHLVYEHYQDSLDIDAQGRATLKTVKRIKVVDAVGVPLLYSEMALAYYQKSSQRKGYKCERRDASNQNDRYFRWDLTKTNVSSGGYLTDEVHERPGFSKVMAGDTVECEIAMAYDSAGYVTRFFLNGFYPVKSRLIEITAADPARLSTRVLGGEVTPQRSGNTLTWSLAALPAVLDPSVRRPLIVDVAGAQRGLRRPKMPHRLELSCRR